MNKKLLIRGGATLLAVLFAGILLLLYQGKEANGSANGTVYAMDTVMTYTVYGKNAEALGKKLEAEIHRIDELFSTGIDTSEISLLNREKTANVSKETADLIERALSIYEDTGGLFDPTVYPLVELWGFSTKQYHVPSAEELSEVMPLVNGGAVTVDGVTVSLGEGQKIDLGGIAKGYTSQRVIDLVREGGAQSAIVTLGGNVQTLGKKTDGSLWRIGIRDPFHPDELIAVVSVENAAVITSGGYERYFEENGETYIHILDPRTGKPADGDLVSVTIVSSDGTLADALSTSLFLMGAEKAGEYWRSHSDAFEAVLVREDGMLLVTEGLTDVLQTNASVTVIGR